MRSLPDRPGDAAARDEPPGSETTQVSTARRLGRLVLLTLGLGGAAGLVVSQVFGWEVLEGCSVLVLALVVFVVGFVALRLLVRRLLWGVGRRLLVSYLLVGVLPLPFIAGFLWVCAWLMSGQLAALRIEEAWEDTRADLRRQAVAVAAGGEVAPGIEAIRDLGPFRLSEPAAGEAEPAAAADAPAARPPGAEGPTGDADASDRDPPSSPGSGRGSPGGGAAGAEADEAPDAPGSDGGPTPERIARVLADPALPAGGVLRVDGAWVLFAREGDALVWRPVEPDVRREIQAATGAGVAFPDSAEIERREAGLHISVDLDERQPVATSGSGNVLFADAADEGSGPIAGEIVYWARSTAVPYLRAEEERSWVLDDPFIFLLRTSIRREMVGLFTGGLEDETNAEIASILPAVLWGLAGTAVLVYLLAALVAGVLVWRIARATARLDAGFRHLERGDFSFRARLRGRDQLAALGQGFDRMAGHLEGALEARAEQEATQRELQVARDLQRSLLPPRDTTLAGLRIAADVEPAAAVGGDFFHLHEEAGGRLVVGVGDVSGHGLPTGIVMAATRALVSAIADSGSADGTDAPELMRTLDRELRRMTNKRTFVTLVCCAFDPRAGRVEVTSAGHLPPWCVRADGSIEAIEGSTRPLGVGPPTDYTTVTAALRPGDRWVLLSDGFVEAVGTGGEPYGFDRFEALLAGLPPADAAETRDRLVRAWEDWTGRVQPEDDRTVCVVEVPLDLGVRRAEDRGERLDRAGFAGPPEPPPGSAP